MLRGWVVVYEQAETGLVTRIHARAETEEDARRLSGDVFEQVYKSTPAKARFAIAKIEEE